MDIDCWLTDSNDGCELVFGHEVSEGSPWLSQWGHFSCEIASSLVVTSAYVRDPERVPVMTSVPDGS